MTSEERAREIWREVSARFTPSCEVPNDVLVKAVEAAILAAIVRAIEEEREATVAFLRVPRGAMQHVADGLADAINRGEHRKPCA